MIKIVMEKQCGCFKKSNFEAEQVFESFEVAKKEAELMCENMNIKFCHKHNFVADCTNSDKIVIKVSLND